MWVFMLLLESFKLIWEELVQGAFEKGGFAARFLKQSRMMGEWGCGRSVGEEFVVVIR